MPISTSQDTFLLLKEALKNQPTPTKPANLVESPPKIKKISKKAQLNKNITNQL